MGAMTCRSTERQRLPGIWCKLKFIEFQSVKNERLRWSKINDIRRALVSNSYPLEQREEAILDMLLGILIQPDPGSV